MGWRLPLLLVSIAAICTACGSSGSDKATPTTVAGTGAPTPSPTSGGFTLTSHAFTDGGAIPAEFTCDGPNQSPPLAWSIVPKGTVSFALRVQDVDTPQQFVHWLVYRINPQTTSIAAGQPPPGAVEATNSFKRKGYGGPCPPAGQRHRYVFTLLSMATELTTSADVDAAELWSTLERSGVTAKAELTGTYQRRG